jgi:TupA-like ATPgrasp
MPRPAHSYQAADAAVFTASNNALDHTSPKADTRLWPSLVRTLAQPRGWSSLVVASHIAAQLALVVASGKWPKQRSGGNLMRGIDFYPWKDLLRALVHGAQLFKVENGYLPPLAFPVSFNEHIFARKFFAPLPMPSLADKLTAKEYVKERVGDQVLPFVAWTGVDIGGLFAAKLPAGRYFLKASNGWGSHLLLNLPDDLSAKRDEIERWAANELGRWFGYDCGEWQYCTFKPRFFLEEFIDFNGIQAPEDYKFFCFRGQVRLIEVDVDRFAELRTALYTPDWKYIPVNYGETPVQRARPRNLEDMIRVAETIGEGMEFTRVDLYSDGNSQIRFGEITLTPGNGVLHFSDYKFDQWLGSLFDKDPRDDLH